MDGIEETIPASVGNVSRCTAEIHTHDLTGTIHVESPSATREFFFKDVLTVWGRALERPGYALEMTVDGAPSTEGEELMLKDKQQITLNYIKE